MKKNTLKKAGIITVSVIAALAVAGSVYMGKLVTDSVLYQNKDIDTTYNTMKQLETWGYDFEAFSSKYQGTEISAVAEDGNEVPATYFDTESTKCVVLVHGAGGDRYSTAPLAEQYLERGFDVIVHDQRGCGSNPDKKVTFGINESLDVRALVKYARETGNCDEVIVHGQSMGGQTTAVYASNVTPGTVEAADAVICDSPVPGMEYMIRDVIGDGEEGANSAFTSYLVNTSKIYMKVVYGISYAEGDTIKVVEKDQLPTLVFVSEQDTVCLPEKVEEVYDSIASENKQIAYVNSKHIEGVLDDPEGYMESVETFLEAQGL